MTEETECTKASEHAHTVECYLAIKRNEVLTWYNIEEPWKYFVKRKTPDTKGHIVYDSMYRRCPGVKSTDRKQIGGYQEEGEGNRKSPLTGTRFLVWCDGNILELQSGDGYTAL